ncbi:MAG: 2-oxo acid dehydrogenase subunit E2 [Ignavibacteria bacterium]|nr:2-oxo acid dehydrogenase subunit E2 [Ignavibacteria bacterium]
MIKEVKLPEVSENIEQGDVIKVLVSVGDEISIDQPLIELETDKALFEVPSTEEGVVKEISVKEGDVINIGSVILKVETNAKEKKEKTPEKKEKTTDKNTEKETGQNEKGEELNSAKKPEKLKQVNEKAHSFESQRNPESETESEAADKETIKASNDPDKVLAPASPSVRRLARELGVEINIVSGSGKDGRISEEDVKNFVKASMNISGSTSIHPSGRSLPDFSKWGEVRIEPMSKIRIVTAESMTNSWTAPMVTQFDKADITLAEEFRKKYSEVVKSKGGNLTITSLLVKICSEALKKFPQFNSSIDVNKKEIIYKNYFNIGIAVDTDRGLLVPVIRNTDKKNIVDISAELNELAEKARTKKIMPDEMDGGNFTISNLGGIGGTAFTPIVYSPQVAILGVSRASNEAVYIGENFIPRMLLPMSLTYDHRIIDGADAARFLRWICEALENPMYVFL